MRVVLEGKRRLLVEKNKTASAAKFPWTIKSPSRAFLEDLLQKAAVDASRVFKGSFNHMACLTLDELQATMGATVFFQEPPATDPTSTQEDVDDDSDDDSDDDF